MTRLKFKVDDGGRKAAGLPFTGRDCVVRAIAIAARRDYRLVRHELAVLARPGVDPDDDGVEVGLPPCRAYLRRLGFRFVSCRDRFGRARTPVWEYPYPTGRLLVLTRRHVSAVVNRTVRDDRPPFSDTAVVGYWLLVRPPA